MTPAEHRILATAYELIGRLIAVEPTKSTLVDLPEKATSLERLELKIKTFFADAPDSNLPLKSLERTYNISYYRTIFCHVAAKHYGMEFRYIAEYINRSIDQARHYCRLASDWMETDPKFKDQYERIIQSL